MELTIITEVDGMWLIEANGATYAVTPLTPGQRRNYTVTWGSDGEEIFPLWQRNGIWSTHGTRDADLLTVLRWELAQRGYLGEAAYQAVGPHRPIYRW